MGDRFGPTPFRSPIADRRGGDFFSSAQHGVDNSYDDRRDYNRGYDSHGGRHARPDSVQMKIQCRGLREVHGDSPSTQVVVFEGRKDRREILHKTEEVDNDNNPLYDRSLTMEYDPNIQLCFVVYDVESGDIPERRHYFGSVETTLEEIYSKEPQPFSCRLRSEDMGDSGSLSIYCVDVSGPNRGMDNRRKEVAKARYNRLGLKQLLEEGSRYPTRFNPTDRRQLEDLKILSHSFVSLELDKEELFQYHTSLFKIAKTTLKHLLSHSEDVERAQRETKTTIEQLTDALKDSKSLIRKLNGEVAAGRKGGRRKKAKKKKKTMSGRDTLKALAGKESESESTSSSSEDEVYQPFKHAPYPGQGLNIFPGMPPMVSPQGLPGSPLANAQMAWTEQNIPPGLGTAANPAAAAYTNDPNTVPPWMVGLSQRPHFSVDRRMNQMHPYQLQAHAATKIQKVYRGGRERTQVMDRLQDVVQRPFFDPYTGQPMQQGNLFLKMARQTASAPRPTHPMENWEKQLLQNYSMFLEMMSSGGKKKKKKKYAEEEEETTSSEEERKPRRKKKGKSKYDSSGSDTDKAHGMLQKIAGGSSKEDKGDRVSSPLKKILSGSKTDLRAPSSSDSDEPTTKKLVQKQATSHLSAILKGSDDETSDSEDEVDRKTSKLSALARGKSNSPPAKGGGTLQSILSGSNKGPAKRNGSPKNPFQIRGSSSSDSEDSIETTTSRTKLDSLLSPVSAAKEEHAVKTIQSQFRKKTASTKKPAEKSSVNALKKMAGSSTTRPSSATSTSSALKKAASGSKSKTTTVKKTTRPSSPPARSSTSSDLRKMASSAGLSSTVPSSSKKKTSPPSSSTSLLKDVLGPNKDKRRSPSPPPKRSLSGTKGKGGSSDLLKSMLGGKGSPLKNSVIEEDDEESESSDDDVPARGKSALQAMLG